MLNDKFPSAIAFKLFIFISTELYLNELLVDDTASDNVFKFKNFSKLFCLFGSV